ncbi:hypothetical protein FHP29_07055 [Nocardioides albidus]|uniref:LppX_LprAFG lipoprotein n=1 Tax=Nocardioides albidus TaxID=1517589 RepID=A0A5C4W3I1_9ACTN|nr:hypothetical protein [Nocardioides albidus]TNM42760.1 hypothetical protein FHP29_07055 [Nocardioides albidus]
MNHRTPRLALAALLTPALLLAGCGDDKTDASNDKPAGENATASATDGASDSAEAGSGELAELSKDDFYPTIIAAQQKAGSFRGTATSTSGGVAVTVETEVSYDGDQPSSHAKTTADSPQKMEMVVVDGVLYIQADGLVPSGKWAKLDPKDPANAGNPLASLGQLADPAKALAVLGTPKELRLVGEETVDGVASNHYEVVLDSSSYAEKLGLGEDVAAAMPPEITSQMWVDAQNRPVKMSMEFETSGVKVASEQTYHDYGADVTVTEPDEADVVSAPALGQG